MCGIAGYAGVRTYDRSVIQGMTDRIRHRAGCPGFFLKAGLASDSCV